MATYRVIRKFVEHYEHIGEADSEWEAGRKAMSDCRDGDMGNHLDQFGDTYVETVNLIESNQRSNGGL